MAIANPAVAAQCAGTPSSTSRSPIGAPRLAPEKAPATMLISVMPVCTVERKRPGSSVRARAMAAPRLPRSAAPRRRAGRDEMIASSDIANRPFSTTRPAITATSIQGKGFTKLS